MKDGTVFSSSLPSFDMELDIFLPAWSLAFEYQGEYHYTLHPYFGSGPAQQKRRDEEKKKVK